MLIWIASKLKESMSCKKARINIELLSSTSSTRVTGANGGETNPLHVPNDRS